MRTTPPSTAPRPAALNICPLGMDERAHQTLRIFFERQMAGVCQLSTEPEAHALLIDGDSYRARDLLAAQQAAGNPRAIILLTLNPASAAVPNGIVVEKPIKVDVFAAALRGLGQRLLEPQARPEPGPEAQPALRFSSAVDEVLAARMKAKAAAPVPTRVDRKDGAAAQLASRERHYYVGSMPDVDLDNPDECAKVFYDPQEFLQGHVARAIQLGMEKGTVVRIIGKAFQDIVIYPFARAVVCTAKSSILYAAARVPLSSDDVLISPLPDSPHTPEDPTAAEPIDSFVWKLALWASRGRLPLGTDLGSPVYIKRWPNLTRLLVPPQAPRILGLWSRRPFSLSGTTKVLNVPQRFAFALFSACSALELAATTQRTADRLIAPEIPPASEKRGLFRMLLSKLVSFRNDDEQA